LPSPPIIDSTMPGSKPSASSKSGCEIWKSRIVIARLPQSGSPVSLSVVALDDEPVDASSLASVELSLTVTGSVVDPLALDDGSVVSVVSVVSVLVVVPLVSVVSTVVSLGEVLPPVSVVSLTDIDMPVADIEPDVVSAVDDIESSVARDADELEPVSPTLAVTSLVLPPHPSNHTPKLAHQVLRMRPLQSRG